jgi:tetratricopeptide (TPR) repeat protein
VKLNISEFANLWYRFGGKRKKVYILITIVITLYLLSGCSRRSSADPAQENQENLPIAETLAAAEELFKQREDAANLREAVTLVGRLRNPHKRNFEVEWKFAKYSCFLGQATTDEKEREKIFETGKSAGEIASRLEPGKPEGYFWYGANLGELSKMNPITVGIKSIDDIREAMNKVIELQPDYQGASAYDILAQIELNTGLTGGKAEKAVEYLEKALELEKRNSNLRLHLAQAYLATDQDAKAKQQLDQMLKMEPNPDYLLEHEAALKEAKRLRSSRF